MRWDDVTKVPEPFSVALPLVRAPACPLDARANWFQVLLAVAGVGLMAALIFGALTHDPVSWVAASLALVGLSMALFVLFGVIRSRMVMRSR